MDRETMAVAGIQTAGPHSVEFTLNRNEDDSQPDVYENIGYGFSATADADANGIADAGAAPIKRFYLIVAPAAEDTIADNIYAIAFAYAFDDDRDGKLDYADAAPFNAQLDHGEEIWAYDSPDLATVGLDKNNATGAALTAAVSLDRIRAVRIWILARTRNPLREAARTKNFVVGDKNINITDSYQYRLLTATVKCRNLGI
jgi:hypothetical protein